MSFTDALQEACAEHIIVRTRSATGPLFCRIKNFQVEFGVLNALKREIIWDTEKRAGFGDYLANDWEVVSKERSVLWISRVPLS